MSWRHRFLSISKSAVAVAVASVLLQVTVATVSMDALSAVRAYAVGESHYSKGQKDALFYAHRYANSHDESDFTRFKFALAKPRGDKWARIALQRVDPDKDSARASFLEGGNHPDDVDKLIRLFVWGKDTPLLAGAISIWTQGDAAIDELLVLVSRARADIQAGRADGPAVSALRTQLPGLNDRLNALEGEFLEELGRASRETEHLLLMLNVLVAVLLMSTGTVFVTSSLRTLRKRELQMTALVASVRDAVVTVDEDWRVVSFNRAAEDLFGLPLELAKKRPFDRFFSNTDGHPAPGPALREALVGGVQQLAMGRSNSTRWVEVSASKLLLGDGTSMTIICRDVTLARQARESERDDLARQNQALTLKAQTDTLTGLSNRVALDVGLAEAVAGARESNTCVTVMFLDLDRFKPVNDDLGHASGDELLALVAQRLLGAVRKDDKVYRVAGDEFAVVTSHGTNASVGAVLAERIVATVREPYALRAGTVSVTVSIGVASYPANGHDAGTILAAADAAMYVAKRRGKNSFHVDERV